MRRAPSRLVDGEVRSTCRHAQRPRSQQGYLLGVVLGAMVIGLTLITALLGLSFTTHRAAIVQKELAEDRRAADGALEAAVEQVRSNPDSPCPAVDAMLAGPAAPAGTVQMSTSNGNDTVWVRCADDELDPTPLAQGDLRVLGAEGYQGAKPWSGTGASDPSDPDLLHQGDEPATLVGGTVVSGQGAFDSTDSGSNGARVSGSYAQGGTGCDVLSPKTNADIERTLLDSDSGDEGEPECDSSQASASLASLSPADMATPPATPSTVPTGCGSYVFFQQGFYSVSQTAALASLLSADCNATYWFTAGVYWFDAPAGAPLTLSDVGSSYVFGEIQAPPGSPPRCEVATTDQTTVILGPSTELEHTGGHLSICGGDGNPNPALVRSQTFSNDVPSFKSVSSPSGDFRFNLRSNDTHPDNLDFIAGKRPATARTCTFLACNGGSSTLRFGVSSPGAGPLDSLEFRWRSFESPIAFPVGFRRVRARLFLAGNNLTPACDFTTDRGRTNDLGSRLDLQPCLDGGAIDDMSDLDNASLFVNFPTQFAATPVGPYCVPECPYRIAVSEPELAANVEEAKASTVSSGVHGDVDDWSDVGAVLEAGGPPAASAEQCTYFFDWEIAGIPQEPVEIPDFCDRAGQTPEERNMQLSGFDNLDVDELTSLVLAIDNGPDMNDVVANPSFNPTGELELGATRVAVNGVICSQADVGDEEPYPGYTRSSTTWFIDILDCLGGLTNLEDAQITLGILPEKNALLASDPFDLGSDVSLVEGPGLEIPQIDYVRLLATTKTVSGITPVTLTSGEGVPDALQSAGTGTSVRVHGDADLHLADLDVRWLGEASEESLFNGTLTVNALSSWQDTSLPNSEVGTVCCGPNYPNVKLVAYVENPDVTSPTPPPPIRGLSRVRLETGSGPSASTVPVIADWQLCHLGGCKP